nr:hypothetical protein BaRGS_010857 [Batillaria attramentaria]
MGLTPATSPSLTRWVTCPAGTNPSNPTFYLNEKDYLYHNSSHERGFVQSANIGTVITVCNILTNLVLVGLVLWDKATRSQFVFQQVLNLALSDLAYSVIVDPFTVYFELQPWKLATWFCVAWMVLDSAFPFVSLLVLIALNADRLLFALSPSLYHRTFRHVTLRGLMLLAPWLVGMGVILPLWLLTATHWPYPGVCMYGIATRAALASAIVSLYVPALGIIVLTVFMLVTIIGAKTKITGEVGGMSGVHGGADKVTVKRCHRALVVALCVTNLVTVITQLPYGAISMLKPNCVESDCQSTVKLMQALVWTGVYKTGVYKTGIYKIGVYKTGIYKTGVYKISICKTGVCKSGVYKISFYKISVYKTGVHKTGVYKIGVYKISVYITRLVSTGVVSTRLRVYKTGVLPDWWSYKSGVYKISVYKTGVYRSGVYKISLQDW